jgi:hypothetical protein
MWAQVMNINLNGWSVQSLKKAITMMIPGKGCPCIRECLPNSKITNMGLVHTLIDLWVKLALVIIQYKKTLMFIKEKVEKSR